MKPVVAGHGRDTPAVDDDREALREALARAREQNLNLRDEVIGARAATAQARKDHDATFYLLDVTTAQLDQLKAALGYGSEVEVADIVRALETSLDGAPPTDRIGLQDAIHDAIGDDVGGEAGPSLPGPATAGVGRRLSAAARRLGRGIGRP